MGQPVIHFEIGCRDKERTSAFYRDAFGWEIDSGPMGMIRTGPGHEIDGHVTALGHEPHNYVTFYISVPHLEAAIARVEELGGTTVIPPVAIPTGRFAWIADVEGTTIGLFEQTAS